MPAHTKVQPKSPEFKVSAMKLKKSATNPRTVGSQPVNIPETNSCLKRAMERLLSNNFPGIDAMRLKEHRNPKLFSEIGKYGLH